MPSRDPWPWHLKVFEQVVEALPREAAALAPPVQPLPQSPHGLVEKLFQPVAVTRNPIVVVVPTELELQQGEQFSERHVAALLAPLGEVGQRVAELLAGGPPLDVRLTGAILSPGKLKPEKIEPRCARLAVPAESNNPAFGGGQLKSELLQTMLQRPVEMLRLVLMFEPADEIICVSNQACLALRVPLDHFVKPQIQRVVQIHIGQNW